MSTPMYDMPEHLMMAVNENGQGPADPEETVAFVCWCGTKGCDKFASDTYAAMADRLERFPDELRATRASRGMSLRAVSGATGISFGALSDIENRRRRPSMGALIALLRWMA